MSPVHTRLAGISNQTAAGVEFSGFGYDYTPGGQIETWEKRLGDGNATNWVMEYDPVQQLTGVKVKDVTDTLIKEYSYGYDAIGNRTSETIDTSASYARHNRMNQLTSRGGGGTTTVEGVVDEPSTVTVNGEDATVRALAGGDEFLFQKQITVTEGENTIAIEATDENGNVESKIYRVVVSEF